MEGKEPKEEVSERPEVKRDQIVSLNTCLSILLNFHRVTFVIKTILLLIKNNPESSVFFLMFLNDRKGYFFLLEYCSPKQIKK